MIFIILVLIASLTRLFGTSMRLIRLLVLSLIWRVIVSIISRWFLVWLLTHLLHLFIFWIHCSLLLCLFICIRLLMLGMMLFLTPFWIIMSILWIRLKRVFHLAVDMYSFRVAFMLIGLIVLNLLIFPIILWIYHSTSVLIELRSLMTSIFVLIAYILLDIFSFRFIILFLVNLFIFLDFNILFQFLGILINLLSVLFWQIHIFILKVSVFKLLWLLIWNVRVLCRLRSLSRLLIRLSR